VETVALDDIDREILSALIQNGRATFTELGRAVGLSPHATAERVRRLREAGVIGGFSASVNLGAVGRGLDAFVDVRLSARADFDAFEHKVAALPAVRELAFVTGRFDYVIRLACEDADDLDRTVRFLRGEADAAVTETRIVMRARHGTGSSMAPSTGDAA
jgi:Lrp/AsnC family transcriptional regulator, leucine-responsive regulatory protein